jgi:hypothetical protein
MKKLVTVLIVVLMGVTSAAAQKVQKVKMYNEVSANISVLTSNIAIPSVVLSYTGGVEVGKYFSTGIMVGYDPLPKYAHVSLSLQGKLPFDKIRLYLMANGGIATEFKEIIPCVSSSAGIGLLLKNGKVINLGLSLTGYYNGESTGPQNSPLWTKGFGLRVGFEF